MSNSSATPVTSSGWKKVDEGRVDSFMDRARQGVHCKLFCKGSKCKHESWEYFSSRKDSKPAVQGLNSSWVTENVVASQRPSTSLFSKYPLIDQFKSSNITGVFNLQEKGEHSSCGPDGIYPSTGYSYDGERDLMAHGVHYHEFPWPDMTAPDNDIVMRSVQVMDRHVKDSGKVLIHCHAGLGRTGLLIACYLVYSQRMPSEEAIKIVRTNRPGAVQTTKQAQFVIGFEKHINHLAMVFPLEVSVKKGKLPQSQQAPLTLATFLGRQKSLLHGHESLPYRYIPRQAHLIMKRLLQLARERPGDVAATAVESFGPIPKVDVEAVAKVREAINNGTYKFDEEEDAVLMAHVLVDWYKRLEEPIICATAIADIAHSLSKPSSPTTPNHFAVIERTFSRHERHTIACTLSFMRTLASILHLTPTQQDELLDHLYDAMTHLRHNTYISDAKRMVPKVNDTTRSDALQFLRQWADTIGTRYFVTPVEDVSGEVSVATILPIRGRIIDAVCEASQFSPSSSTLASISPTPSASEVTEVKVLTPVSPLDKVVGGPYGKRSHSVSSEANL